MTYHVYDHQGSGLVGHPKDIDGTEAMIAKYFHMDVS